MNYVPGYEWDVFVSFARSDNEAVPQDERWVSRFVSDLRIGIRNWLGDADKLKVFFREDSLGIDVKWDAMRDYVRNSAIFIAVVSPSYIRDTQTRTELLAFSSSGDASGRLFVIECRPIDDYAQLPGLLRQVVVTPFLVREPGERTSRPMSPEQDARPWINRMEALTKDIAASLEKIKAGKSLQNDGHPARPVKREVVDRPRKTPAKADSRATETLSDARTDTKIDEGTVEPLKVFISYSHEDEKMRVRMGKHLASLVSDGLIRIWHDREIEAGADWEANINEEIEAADIILLLVSASFLDSRYCQKELLRALDRRSAGKAMPIPIILRPCDWTSVFNRPKFKTQALPRDDQPVAGGRWPNQDAAFTAIAKELRLRVGRMRSPL